MDRGESAWAGGGGSYDYDDDPPKPAPEPKKKPAPKKEPPAPRPDDQKPDPPPRRNDGPRAGSGLVLGRFVPPHAGHRYLIDFARGCVQHLTVLVLSSERDAIPGALRVAWLRELHPGVNVLHARDEAGPQPGDPDFARAWVGIVRRYVPDGPSLFFASDDHGCRFAEQLGATYVPVDPGRAIVPISATRIREEPLACFAFLPPCVRPWFVRRVAIVGAESTGKTTLAGELSIRYRTVFAPEYLRTLDRDRQGQLSTGDLTIAARAQMASEDALARVADRVLFCDTDLRTVRLWSERLFDRAAPWILDEELRRPYDLVLLCAPDVPFVGAPERDRPEARRALHARLRAAPRGGEVVELDGDWDARRARAIAAVDALLAQRGPSARAAFLSV
jgi:NadR type nicotinamide-nucleotide adenylyltransferase